MGLLPMQTQGPPYADPNAPVAPQGAPQGQDEQPNVSPEEQQQYDTVMGKAAEIIYGDGKVMPQILDALKPAKGAAQAAGDGDGSDPEGGNEQATDPKEAAKGNPAIIALANTATQIVSKLDASSKEAGQQIPDDILYHAGSEIVGMLAEVAEAAGFHTYSEEEVQGAFFQAVDNYRPIAEAMGRTDEKTLKDQFGQILDADAQGQLEPLLSGQAQQQGMDQPAAQPQQ